MIRNQTQVRTETLNRGPEPCSALFLERAAPVVEGNGATILQLNVEGLTNSKLTIIELLAYTNSVTICLVKVLSQQVHVYLSPSIYAILEHSNSLSFSGLDSHMICCSQSEHASMVP